MVSSMHKADQVVLVNVASSTEYEKLSRSVKQRQHLLCSVTRIGAVSCFKQSLREFALSYVVCAAVHITVLRKGAVPCLPSVGCLLSCASELRDQGCHSTTSVVGVFACPVHSIRPVPHAPCTSDFNWFFSWLPSVLRSTAWIFIII